MQNFVTGSSPGSKSKPRPIPGVRISISNAFDFDNANKENLGPNQRDSQIFDSLSPSGSDVFFPSSGQLPRLDMLSPTGEVLFPSIGTSPRLALSLNSPTKRELQCSGTDIKRRVIKLGKNQNLGLLVGRSYKQSNVLDFQEKVHSEL